jgi:hypothetical protein
MRGLVSGDDIVIEQTLTKNNSTFAIDSGATVKASLISRDKQTIIVAPVSVLEATTGSDWANSKIIILFDSTDTDTATDFGPVYLEIQVDDGGKLTWFVKAELVQGTIDQ